MMCDGVLAGCNLINDASPGAMPVERLDPVFVTNYESRTVGYGRQYAAMGVNEQVDLLARIWYEPKARIGMYAIISQSQEAGQYRIGNVQHIINDDGLKVTDLTLSRLDDLYDVDAE